MLSTVSFVAVTDPYNMEPTPEPEYPNITNPILASADLDQPRGEGFLRGMYDGIPGLEALSQAVEYIRPAPSTNEGNVQHSSNNLDFILNPADPEGGLSTGRLNSHSAR